MKLLTALLVTCVATLAAATAVPAGQTTQKPPTYTAFGSGHLLRSVTEDGKLITLEDGSLWEVKPSERYRSAEWEVDASMSVRASQPDNGYDCELINTTEDEGVMAKLLPKPQH